MNPADPPARLADEVARLEVVARALESEGLTPAELGDLADEALAIAQRISGLLADARGPGAGPAGTPPSGAPAD